MIFSSVKKTFEVIKKNKNRLLLIFFLQIIFFTALTIIFYQTLIPAMQNAKNAMDYYDSINMTESPGMYDYLGESPIIIYENYIGMMNYLKLMVLFIILTFIIINSIIWAFSDDLFNNKNLKQFFIYLINFAIITIAFIALVYILIFNKLKSSLAQLEVSLTPLVGFSILLIILLYFLFISFSLVNKRKIKDILKLTFKLGIFKIHKILLIYLINLIIISLFSYLIYLTVDGNMAILPISVIFFVLSFIFSRLFLIISINELVKKN